MTALVGGGAPITLTRNSSDDAMDSHAFGKIPQGLLVADQDTALSL